MRISLINAGKRFNRQWIFRHLNYDFIDSCSYAITGPNGSGKSTLLHIIASASIISEGSVVYFDETLPVPAENIYKNFSIAAPYLELIEEMSLNEMISFHSKMKPLIPEVSAKEIINIVGLKHAADKQIRYFSSGMKQRVKLALAIFSDVKVTLLDEPTTNLDTAGILLYHDLINRFTAQKLLVICSNDPKEYDFARKIINMDALNEFVELPSAGNQ